MLKEISDDVRMMWSRKYFAVALPLMAVLSFVSLLLNPTVGIDDTAFDIYFEHGVAPAVGRWCLFLINKIFPLSYNPYFVECVGILIFCLSVSLWCVVFYKIFGAKISDYGYLLFGCVMISSPITAEVVIYYLHNGIFIGYGMSALAILWSMKLLQADCGRNMKNKIKHLFPAVVCLTAAMGFYESFMLVFLVGIALVWLSVRITDNAGYERRVWPWIKIVMLVGVFSVLLRSLIVNAMILGFGLQEQTKVLKSRGLYEFQAWFDGSRSFSDFVRVMKDFFVKYYINGAVYLPITLLVLGIIVLLVFAVRLSVKKRDGLILAAALGAVLLPWVMPLLEGRAAYYRSGQYIPLLTAFSALMVSGYVTRVISRTDLRRINIVRVAAVFLSGVLLYAQAYEMNRWLYLDALKYEDTRKTLEGIAHSILQCENPQKPICIVGSYEVPQNVEESACCPSWSKKYAVVEFFVKNLDETLWEEYNTENGYAFAETPRLSFLDWGMTAFFGFDRQIIRFWEMHGYHFTEDGNLEHYVEARKEMENGPVWPKEGSVVEKEDHIIVNLGNK